MHDSTANLNKLVALIYFYGSNVPICILDPSLDIPQWQKKNDQHFLDFPVWDCLGGTCFIIVGPGCEMNPPDWKQAVGGWNKIYPNGIKSTHFFIGLEEAPYGFLPSKLYKIRQIG